MEEMRRLRGGSIENKEWRSRKILEIHQRRRGRSTKLEYEDLSLDVINEE